MAAEQEQDMDEFLNELDAVDVAGDAVDEDASWDVVEGAPTVASASSESGSERAASAAVRGGRARERAK